MFLQDKALGYIEFNATQNPPKHDAGQHNPPPRAPTGVPSFKTSPPRPRRQPAGHNNRIDHHHDNYIRPDGHLELR